MLLSVFQETRSWILGAAIITGIVCAIFFKKSRPTWTRLGAKQGLIWGVILLGFTMNLGVVLQVGLNGLGYTLISLVCVLSLGFLLGRLFGLGGSLSTLLASGTAICGGSAIAAMAPAIGAKHSDVSMAFGVVFILNAVALFLFPAVGHAFGLSQEQFGVWSALAIHDTSSVVGATQSYGHEALEVGTSIKLARSLWIFPLALGCAFLVSQYHKKKTKQHESQGLTQEPPQKIAFPWFILGFLCTSAFVSAFSQWQYILSPLAKTVSILFLVCALFCIGAQIDIKVMAKLGPRVFGCGMLLWLITAIGTLVWVVGTAS